MLLCCCSRLPNISFSGGLLTCWWSVRRYVGLSTCFLSFCFILYFSFIIIFKNIYFCLTSCVLTGVILLQLRMKTHHLISLQTLTHGLEDTEDKRNYIFISFWFKQLHGLFKPFNCFYLNAQRIYFNLKNDWKVSCCMFTSAAGSPSPPSASSGAPTSLNICRRDQQKHSGDQKRRSWNKNIQTQVKIYRHVPDLDPV